jgi:hypothetical protein
MLQFEISSQHWLPKYRILVSNERSVYTTKKSNKSLHYDGPFRYGKAYERDVHENFLLCTGIIKVMNQYSPVLVSYGGGSVAPCSVVENLTDVSEVLTASIIALMMETVSSSETTCALFVPTYLVFSAYVVLRRMMWEDDHEW